MTRPRAAVPAVLLLTLTAAGLAAGPGNAQSAAALTYDLSASATSPGQTVSFSGEGCAPSGSPDGALALVARPQRNFSGQLQVTFDSGADGTFSGVLPVPLNLPAGTYATSVSCYGGAQAGWPGQPGFRPLEVDELPCTITGTEDADSITGTEGDDVVCGLGGDDRITGAGGRDRLLGGAGADVLHGDAADDLLSGDVGKDALRGGDGRDWLVGGEDDDLVGGDAGDDDLLGNTGRDVAVYISAPGSVRADLGLGFATGAGTDFLTGVEDLRGSAHNDSVVGSPAANQLLGGDGRDQLGGGGGSDLLGGGAGDDDLAGGNGEDLLVGGDGTDDLRAGSGLDVCYDGGGARVSCEAPSSGSARTTLRTRQREAGAPSSTFYYPLGNQDYLYVFGSAATAALDMTSWPSVSRWEHQVCRILRFTVAKASCSADGVITALQKYQVAWAVNRAKAFGRCAAVVWDYGRHGVNQLRKRWKTRLGTDDETSLAVFWVTPGRTTDVRLSDPSDVGSSLSYVPVTCQ